MKESIIKSCRVKPWPAGKSLFKYLKKEHADKLFNDGELRIGTLYDFRKDEHGDNRSDEGEGKKTIYEVVDDIIKDHEHNTLSPFVKQFLSIEKGAKNTRLINGEFMQTHDCGDCYVYCMSREHNEALYDDFKADVCVCIKSPYKFIHALGLALKKKTLLSRECYLSTCVYCERMQCYGRHNDYHPAIIKIKTDNYKRQKEVRAIWLPDMGLTQLVPLIVNLDKKLVTRYCEVFSCKVTNDKKLAR